MIAEVQTGGGYSITMICLGYEDEITCKAAVSKLYPEASQADIRITRAAAKILVSSDSDSPISAEVYNNILKDSCPGQAARLNAMDMYEEIINDMRGRAYYVVFKERLVECGLTARIKLSWYEKGLGIEGKKGVKITYERLPDDQEVLCSVTGEYPEWVIL
jgi:hypothetical protein